MPPKGIELVSRGRGVEHAPPVEEAFDGEDGDADGFAAAATGAHHAARGWAVEEINLSRMGLQKIDGYGYCHIRP